MTPPFSIISNSHVHPTVKIVGWANIYSSILNEGVKVGPFTEIGGAVVGDRTKIGKGNFICPGVTIGRDCFLAHHIAFVNDLYKTPEVYENISEMESGWEKKLTTVGDCVRIGSHCVIHPVNIGAHSVIGSGSVVVADVPPYSVVAGVPAKVIRTLEVPS